MKQMFRNGELKKNCHGYLRHLTVLASYKLHTKDCVAKRRWSFVRLILIIFNISGIIWFVDRQTSDSPSAWSCKLFPVIKTIHQIPFLKIRQLVWTSGIIDLLLILVHCSRCNRVRFGRGDHAVDLTNRWGGDATQNMILRFEFILYSFPFRFIIAWLGAWVYTF